MRSVLASIMILVIGAACVTAGYFAGANSIASHFATSFVTTTHTPVQDNEVFLMKVNGSTYWADDVSKDTVIGFPGYSYFLNGSVKFDGVKFQTIRPSTYRDCPGSTANSTIVYAGAIRFNMTFPDKTTETVGDVIGDSIYTFVISQHTPKAGMLIVYVNDYPHSPVLYAVFLLVSSCCAPPYLA